MPREEKKIELKPVEDAPVLETAVLRLEGESTREQDKPVQLKRETGPQKVSKRLAVPEHENFETRSYQPGVEELIGLEDASLEDHEGDWGKAAAEHRPIPWGWFVLIALTLAGAVIWSLTQVNESDSQADKVREETQEILRSEEEEDAKAGRLVELIQSRIERFFEARSISEMMPLVRQPERVRPLMEDYYAEKPLVTSKVLRTLRFEPVTIGNLASFWLVTVELESKERRNLIIDVRDPESPLIDWETLVCHQPMDWDQFASERPENESLDFRVHVQLDNFHSHEFANSSKWTSFKLTTTGGDETIFGYGPANGEVTRQIFDLIRRNNGQPTSMILRISIPEGLQSRSGVVIEKVISPRWLYLEVPISGS